MKRLFSSLVLAVLLMATVLSGGGALAQNTATVQIDGRVIDYQYVDPVIMNSRTMVPIRETAEYLGMTVNWDEATSTMTFNKGTDVIRHTIKESVIYVNGVAQQFDTPSTIVDGRSLMPVRMLAQAIGAEVTWDSVNYRVIIVTSQSASQITYTPQITSAPQIISATPAKTTVAAGETTTATIVANGDTTMVQLISSTTGTLASSSVYTVSGTSRIFTVSFTAPLSSYTSQTIMVYAGDANGYKSTSDQYFLISVTDEGGVEITDYDISDTSVSYGDEIEIYVYTQTGATKVWVIDPNDDTLDSTTSYDKSDDDEYEWFLSFEAEESGNYYIYAKDNSGNEDYVKVKITVEDEEDDYAISSVEVEDKTVDEGDTVYVTVYTGTAAEYVWIEDPDGDEVDDTDSYRKRSGERVWELEFDADLEGTYTVYAENEDGDTSKKTFKITFN